MGAEISHEQFEMGIDEAAREEKSRSCVQKARFSGTRGAH
jgi:hypothetical protein